MTNETYQDIKILIADDIGSMRRVVLSMLRSLGFRSVIVAENGLEAWKLLKENEIDLVITDWNMPYMTGIELLHEVRSSRKYENLPFIMVTGEIDESRVAHAAEMDVDAYILKPFDPKQLEDRINTVLYNRDHPSDYQKILNKAMELRREKNYPEAIKHYEAAITLHPEKAAAYFRLGQLLEERGDYKRAESAYEKAVSINSTYIKALDGLARLYAMSGDKRKLFEALRKLTNLSPENIGRQLKLAKLAFELEEAPTAKHSLTRIVKLLPDNEKALLEVGTLFLQHNMVDEAETLFNKLLTKNPKEPTYLNYVGDILTTRKKYDNARDFYLKSLKISENEQIHLRLAKLYIAIASKRLAEHHLQSALYINPESKEARKALRDIDAAIAEARQKQASDGQGRTSPS